MRNGADLLMQAALESGVEVCFANPGTTEMPMVEALDRMDDGAGGAPKLRGVLALHENVCSGAADGFARVSGKPAMTLLHLGPGFANALANLHNARRARSPIVNLIGEHATWHQAGEAPLSSEIERLTGWCSAWTRRNGRAADCGRDMAEACAQAASGPGRVASLIVPHDYQLAEVESPAPMPFRPAGLPSVAPERVEAAAAALRGAKNPALFLGHGALHGEGLEAAGEVAGATGAALIALTGFARLDAGRGRPRVRRLPYFPEDAAAALDQHDVVVICGAEPPVSFFGYHNLPSRFLEGREGVAHLASAEEDAAKALRDLSEALNGGGNPRDPSRITNEPDAQRDGASREGVPDPWRPAAEDGAGPQAGGLARLAGPERPAAERPWQSGAALTPETLAQAVASRLPEGAIVCLTAVTGGAAWGPAAMHAAPHTQLALTGGAIGCGLAMGVGAAIARPEARVVCLEADGSGAYIAQALWSQAREGLNVTNVIYANRAYKILGAELERAGNLQPGALARSMVSLQEPAVDWVSLAKGFGVPGERAEDAEGFAKAVERSFATPGPSLIEAVL